MGVIHTSFTSAGAGSGVLRLARRPAAVAALNLSPVPGDVEGNLERAGEALTRVRRENPSLRWVVLPELFASGYTDLPAIHRYAEDAEEGPSARRFCALARDLDLYIAYGFAERLPGTSGASGVADSANLVGPEGVLLSYRKRHLVRETGEDQVFVPGVELPTVEAAGVRVVLVICWDLGFPEVVRGAALEGAELVLAPAGWREPYGAQYGLSCAARALDNGIYLASANQLGDYPEAFFGTPGHVYGPNGDRISETVGTASVGELDPEVLAAWRLRYGNTLRLPGGSQLDSLEACS
jgi:predicted amidohydrolase